MLSGDLGGFTGHDRADRFDERSVGRAIPLSLPALQCNCVKFAEAKRRFDVVDPDRQIGAPALRSIGLIANEPAFAANRSLAPDDEDAACRIEVRLNILTPFGTGGDLRIPPDVETVRLERPHQRFYPAPILGLVGHEDIAHSRPPTAASDCCAAVINANELGPHLALACWRRPP